MSPSGTNNDHEVSGHTGCPGNPTENVVNRIQDPGNDPSQRPTDLVDPPERK